MTTTAITSMREMRRSGNDVVGDRPWGTHFCNFYESGKDLLDMLLSYFKAGLEDNEFCVWVVSEPLSERVARDALRAAIPDFDDYVSKRSIEVFDGRDWYMKGGTFDSNRVMSAWNEKLDRALDRGYLGLRGTGNTAWLQKKDWKAFSEYEQLVNDSVAGRLAFLLCTYSLDSCGANELLDVMGTHQFATARRRGRWELIETPELKQAKAEIKKMNDELEQRVVERTRQLTAVNEELTKEVIERQHAEDALRQAEETVRTTQTRLSRATQIATTAEFAAAIAHEINQPLAAVVANGHACLRWLSVQPPGLVKAQEAAERIVRDGTEAGEVVRRIRALFKHAPVDKIDLDLNEVIAEVLQLLSGERTRRGVSVEADLEKDLGTVAGDRVQLQQVVFNLLLNGIEAMDSVLDRPKKLFIRSKRQSPETVLVEIRDSGVGLKDPEKVFEAFFTSKENGMGMGLAVCRSIIDAHHGRLWAASGEGAGTTFSFTIPAATVSGATLEVS
ncbi:MAG: MEDS domain-containing protein [Candidatus Sulfotelmatobacter sp.]